MQKSKKLIIRQSINFGTSDQKIKDKIKKRAGKLSVNSYLVNLVKNDL